MRCIFSALKTSVRRQLEVCMRVLSGVLGLLRCSAHLQTCREPQRRSSGPFNPPSDQLHFLPRSLRAFPSTRADITTEARTGLLICSQLHPGKSLLQRRLQTVMKWRGTIWDLEKTSRRRAVPAVSLAEVLIRVWSSDATRGRGGWDVAWSIFWMWNMPEQRQQSSAPSEREEIWGSLQLSVNTCERMPSF